MDLGTSRGFCIWGWDSISKIEDVPSIRPPSRRGRYGGLLGMNGKIEDAEIEDLRKKIENCPSIRPGFTRSTRDDREDED